MTRRLRPSPRNERTPVLRDSVLDEAARMFLENGYNRTRMQDIAESFGVTHAALYYHFQNKQDILAQLNVRSITYLNDQVAEIARSGKDPVTKLLQALSEHTSYVANHPAFVATLLEHDLEIPGEEFAELQRLRRRYTGYFEEFYEEGCGLALLPDIETTVAVSLLLGACNWIYRWYSPSGGIEPAQLQQQVMQLLEAMISPVS